ncbi:ATP-binding cassette domain-containing protein [Flavobacterium agrisoli]|uniref:ATP-binding cassette domain-containing protein n=1 Tax=Flavobacterium agrisoli TaxID=2793066 RepID=A0A934UK33_9FLAO|nr:ATP-binding cassette domain-containing protein [Flavobacterium agrisoli]MBK0370143.1 ATP-binding cassette domain-containing protein [Flavobacterium agrisoli]
MYSTSHWELLLSNQVDKKKFIDALFSGNDIPEMAAFSNLNGILFSDLAIEAFIEKEFQYDIVASPTSNRKLRTFSSGERKKEFLKYCIHQKPDYIIFDNPLDHLDQASRLLIAQEIENLSKEITVIQLVNRKNDLFPFITNSAEVKDNTFQFFPIEAHQTHTKDIQKKSLPFPAENQGFEGETLIELKNVSVSYEDRKIINDISWTITKGDFWQLIGPNGSGKSTILSLITGDNPKGYGQELYLFGRKKGSGESVWDIKKNIGYFSTAMMDLFQKSHTFEQMILSGFFDSIGLYTQPTTHQKLMVNQWLEVIEMSHLRNKIFTQLSLGQQRVALIIRAVLKHPPLLILDEPVEGLDDENTAMVIQLINLLVDESKMAIVYVSHRIEPDLHPKAIFELCPSEHGSVGKIKK